ncbi:MAG: zinc ribbon domain-containing protein [Anaerolineaceae bacterium]|nr:zinc ribbon domain-containing protein [Anaerolineaceae bacterium]
MPLYEYQCSKCNKTFEQIVPFSKAGLIPPCPFCGASETHKKISVAASFASSSSGSSSVSSGGGCGSSGGFT